MLSYLGYLSGWALEGGWLNIFPLNLRQVWHLAESAIFRSVGKCALYCH